jgi:Ca2+-binding RTX toxin-like protein
MAVNQILQAHDEFFNGSGEPMTYGGSVVGIAVIRTNDGNGNPGNLPSDDVVGPTDGQGRLEQRTEDLNRPPPTLLPVDYDGDYNNEFLYDDIDELQSDKYYEGLPGFTIVSYWGAPEGLTASLSNPEINTGAAAGDTYGPSVEGLGGTAFNDTLIGDHRGNILLGGEGQDFLYGLAGDDRLFGDDGDDKLYGGEGADCLIGGEGRDTASYWGATAGVEIYLAHTVDNKGEAAGDWYDSIEVIDGSRFNDIIEGGKFANTFWGDDGSDLLKGKAGNDTLSGGNGDDKLYGGSGADHLNGGAGRDTASYWDAASGVEVHVGRTWANKGEAAGDSYVSIEVIDGSRFNDVLVGDAGSNTFWGDAGNDALNGGAGADILGGGAGSDTFIFDTALSASNVDTINDFSVANGDFIQLSTSVFSIDMFDVTLASHQFTKGSAATSSAHRIVYNNTTGELFYDADGAGGMAQIKFANIGKELVLKADMFLVI